MESLTYERNHIRSLGKLEQVPTVRAVCKREGELEAGGGRVWSGRH